MISIRDTYKRFIKSNSPFEGAERKEIAQWAILAKEPDCRARGMFYRYLSYTFTETYSKKTIGRFVNN